ncbi:MAG: hypothetical protein PHC51_05000 [bacterium]|nr:hypothetical protein [bacterium]
MSCVVGGCALFSLFHSAEDIVFLFSAREKERSENSGFFAGILLRCSFSAGFFICRAGARQARLFHVVSEILTRVLFGLSLAVEQ